MHIVLSFDLLELFIHSFTSQHPLHHQRQGLVPLLLPATTSRTNSRFLQFYWLCPKVKGVSSFLILSHKNGMEGSTTISGQFTMYILQNEPAIVLYEDLILFCFFRLVNLFGYLKCEVLGLHAQMHQKQRLKNLERFVANPYGVLVSYSPVHDK